MLLEKPVDPREIIPVCHMERFFLERVFRSHEPENLPNGHLSRSIEIDSAENLGGELLFDFYGAYALGYVHPPSQHGMAAQYGIVHIEKFLVVGMECRLEFRRIQNFFAVHILKIRYT